MPGPWKLLSPDGVLHHVKDEAALLALARENPGLYHEQKVSSATATGHQPRPSPTAAGHHFPSPLVLSQHHFRRCSYQIHSCRHRQPSAAASRGWRWSSPYPFERRSARPLTKARSTVRAQILRELCGSSGTASAALGGLGRGRSAGRGRGRRPPTCCVHAAACMRSRVCLTEP